jgi:exonuclease SbcC
VRPVKLVAEGFSAFRDRVEIDFEGADFFALVGPTGAGKSSVIDAVCFALYGSVPRYEHERAVAPVITVGAAQAKVSLTFEVGGESYLATRVARRLPRGGGATTREARLERLGADGQSTEVLAGSADEVTTAVEELIGLVFKHFTRCVVLPQGEFARFLHDKPAERQGLLVNLLDIDIYNRMGQRARARADELRNDAALAQVRMNDLAFATESAAAEEREQIAALMLLRTELAAGAAEVSQLAATATAAEGAATRALSLASLLGAIEVPRQVAEAAAQSRELDAAAVGAKTTVESAEESRRGLELAVAALPDLSELTMAVAAHDDANRLAEGLGSAARAVRNATAILDTARIPAEAAETAVGEAEESLAALRRTHSAAELAEHLKVGAACPVCQHTVTVLPPRTKPAGLAGAEKVAADAREQAKTAALKLAEAKADLAAAQARSDTLEHQHEEALTKTAVHPDFEKVAALITEVRLQHDQLAKARRAEEVARTELAGAAEIAERVRSALSAAWTAFDAQRDPVVALGPPRPQRNDLVADWTALTVWASSERPAQLELAAVNSAKAAEASQTAGSLLTAMAESCASCGLDVSGDIAGRASTEAVSAMREAAVAATTGAEHRLRAVTDGMAELARITVEYESLTEESAVAQLLGTLLAATGFQRWLVGEALDLLVEGASATLIQLSSGQYSLARDDRNEFVVVDHRNADERRPAKSLSGGETFQASLALALALADQIAGLSAAGAARLEAIFLDEGFGTLDPDSLAVVADAIESLGSSDRVVGIVTHVRELAERVPVRFEVRRGVRTSTVERVAG